MSARNTDPILVRCPAWLVTLTVPIGKYSVDYRTVRLLSFPGFQVKFVPVMVLSLIFY
jgi:hypothetical protein